MSFSLKDIVLGIQVDLAGLQAGLNSAKGEIQSSTATWGKNVQQFGRNMKNVGNEARMAGTGAVMAVAPIIAVLAGGVKGAAEWGGQLQTLKTIGKGTEDQMAATTASIIDLSNTWGMSVGEITEAAIEFAAVGYSMEDSILLVNNAAILSRGGLGTMEQATTLLVQGMKQFKISAEDSGRIMDTMAYIANETSSRVGDLTTSLGYAGTVSSELNIPLEEVAAVIGVVHNQLQDASMSGTSFRQVMTRLKDPTREAQATLDLLGVSFYDSEGKMKPFLDIIDEVNVALQVGNKLNVESIVTNEELVKGKARLKAEMEELRHAIAVSDSTDPNLEALRTQLEETRHEYNLLGQLATTMVQPGIVEVSEALKNQALSVLFGVRGQNMYNAVVATGTDEVRRLADGAGDAGYALDVATDITTGASYQFDILKESLRNTSIAIGQDILPMVLELAVALRANLPAIKETAKAFTGGFIIAVKVFAGAIGMVVGAIRQLPKPASDAILGIMGVLTVVLAIVGPLLIFTGMMLSAVGSVVTLVGTIAASATIMGYLATAFTILTGPIAIAIAAIALLALAWKNNWFDIQGKTATAIEYLSGLWDGFVHGLSDMWHNAKVGIETAYNDIINGVRGFVEDNKQALNILAGIILSIATLGGWVIWKNNIFGIKDTVTSLYNTIIEIFTTLIPQVMEFGKAFIEAYIDGGKQVYAMLTEAGRTFIRMYITGAKEIYDQVVKPFFNEVNNMITKALDFLEPARIWGRNLINSFVDGLKAGYNDLRNAASDMADVVEDYIGVFSPTRRGALANLMKWGPNLAKSFSDGLAAGKGGIVKTMSDITDGLIPNDVRLQPRLKVDLSAVVDELKLVAEEIANMAQELIIVDELGLDSGLELSSPSASSNIGLSAVDLGAILTPGILPKTPAQTFMEAINTTNISDSSSIISNRVFSRNQDTQSATHVQHNSIVIHVKEVASKSGVDSLLKQIDERLIKTTRNEEQLGI